VHVRALLERTNTCKERVPTRFQEMGRTQGNLGEGYRIAGSVVAVVAILVVVVVVLRDVFPRLHDVTGVSLGQNEV